MKRAFALALLVSACNTSVDLTEYDQSCAVAADCASVPGPDPCGCACEVAAVNVKEAARYNADWNDRQGSCVGANQCKPCAALPGADCAGGRCVAR